MATPLHAIRSPIELSKEIEDVVTSTENKVRGRTVSINKKLDQLRDFLHELIERDNAINE